MLENNPCEFLWEVLNVALCDHRRYSNAPMKNVKKEEITIG